jgi:hypothetical protein
MESEDIVVDQRDKNVSKSEYLKGPIPILGSKRFFSIYQVDKFKSLMTICQRPDSTSKTLINDYLNTVDMSTFLEDGTILIKIKDRFMIFSAAGGFKNEAQFNDKAGPYTSPNNEL